VGTIKCSVRHAEQLDIGTDNAELRELIATRITLDELPAFGGLDRVTTQSQGGNLQTTHQLHVEVTEAKLRVAGQSFVLYGFGPETKVFDFKNIAGRLLAEDLQKLEHVLSGASRWRLQRSGVLLNATADFVRSELNMLIAEHVATQGESSQDVCTAVETHFGGLVDANYVARASGALSAAITRLYGAELLEPAAWLCALAALLTSASFVLGWPRYEVWPTIMATLGAGALAWLVLEWRTRRRITGHFDGNYGERIISQLKASGSIRRWRKGVAIALPSAVLCALVATAMLPPVQAQRQGYRDQLQSDELLQGWFSFGANVDLQLRRYPAHAELVRKAAEGEQRAIVALGWELLLGANNTPMDVAEAGRWLDKVKPEIRESTYWKSAKAVQALKEESTPDALRKAAQDLTEASGHGLAEADYWLARLYLAPQGPLHDPRQGMLHLTKAADKYHAHAALLAAQKHARGEGVKRNANLARRYATIASKEGLTEAEDFLKP
jgi:hypothetical protein